MCPNSVFGTSRPSTNSADPMPVPSVRMRTVPVVSRPAPKRISASPAASASFVILTGRASSAAMAASAANPTQEESMLAAVIVTPPIVTDGIPTPTGTSGPAPASCATLSTMSRMTAMHFWGVEGFGVLRRIRWLTSSPDSVSTTAVLMPLPPMSTPIASLPVAMFPSRPPGRGFRTGGERPTGNGSRALRWGASRPVRAR